MDTLMSRPATFCNFPPATIVAGTTTTLSTTGTTTYSINGKSYTKTAITNGATPTTDSGSSSLPAFRPVPTNFGSVFVICFDSAGNLKVCQGSIEALTAAGLFVQAPQFPTVPENLCPIGYLILKVGATGSAWTFGTSNLTGPPTGVVETFVPCTTLPDRPQVA